MTHTEERLPAAALAEAVRTEVEQGSRLLTMVGVDERPLGGGFTLHYVFDRAPGALHTIVALLGAAGAPWDGGAHGGGGAPLAFPSVTSVLPAAHWYEREVQDLLGLLPVGHPDPRRLALHEDWPANVWPLRKDFDRRTQPPRAGVAPEGFLPVEGEGIYQLPVGPVHAGVIEPGHFRFHAVGETVLLLEARLFYTHRGIEKQMEGLDVAAGLISAERVCGACAASHAAAYCLAVEQLAGVAVPRRAQLLRMIVLELERLFNHIGDVGNICAGAGLALGVMQGGRLKERLMQLNERLTGHRWLRGFFLPGGVRRDLVGDTLQSLQGELAEVALAFAELQAFMLGHRIFQERVTATGVLTPEVGAALGSVGVAARASGLRVDERVDQPYLLYGEFAPAVPVQTAGDVYARMKQRMDEVAVSYELIRRLIAAMTPGPVRIGLPPLPAGATAVASVESPRGSNVHWLMTDREGRIYRYRIRSASFANWPLVPIAVVGNLVPDFPLINKSFELCYACLDR